jgi:hypothetical protein
MGTGLVDFLVALNQQLHTTPTWDLKWAFRFGLGTLFFPSPTLHGLMYDVL